MRPLTSLETIAVKFMSLRLSSDLRNFSMRAIISELLPNNFFRSVLTWLHGCNKMTTTVYTRFLQFAHENWLAVIRCNKCKPHWKMNPFLFVFKFENY